ncbi:MAG: 4Fe-4S binding protein [bacterium]|nr:4Fe-4S binding protein [bacterium]
MTISKKDFERITRFAPAINWFARQIRIPVLGRFLVEPWFFGFRDTRRTRGRVVSLNQDVPVGPSRVLPYDLLAKIIEKASYRVLLNWCFCRAGMNCRKYPHEIGCLMLGEATRGMVKEGIAREVSVEESLAVVRKARDLGLVHMVMWIKGEVNLLANEKKEGLRMLEICQCCPCCCLALRNIRHLGPASRGRFKGIGYMARLGEGCTGCGACRDICPVGIIEMVEGKPRIGESCLGCGLCAHHCPPKAIEIVSGGKDAVENDLLEYFEGINIS